MHNSSGNDRLYHYVPSLTAAIIFIVLFSLTAILHVYQATRTRTWFMIPLIVGAFFELAGYIGRAVGHHQTPNYTLGPYIIQVLFILLAPLFFAATIYMELGRIIRAVKGEAASFIKPQVLTKLFVAGDIVSFLVQSTGGGVIASANTDHTANLGAAIIITGLALQLLFFTLFILVALTFHRRFLRLSSSSTPATAESATPPPPPAVPYQPHLLALYIASTLITIRSIFRIVEYVQGNDGFLLDHEAFLYVFDATLMFWLLVVLNVVHPSEIGMFLKEGGRAVRGLLMVVEK